MERKMKITSGFIAASLLFLLVFTPAMAAPLRGPAVDGDGLMAVSPTSITYGSTGNTLVFTFTANNDFVAGSSVEIVIPAGWTAPTLGAGAGHVSWSAGTCLLNGGPPVSVQGSTIVIDLERCLTGEQFTVTYASAAPGSIANSPYTFQVYTDIGTGGGGVLPLTAPSPTVTIEPKPLSVSSAGLVPANKIYDGTTGATLTIGSPSLVGIIGGDAVSLDPAGAQAVFADKHAGTGKLVYISGLTLSGPQAGYYTLVQPTRTANISPRAVTIEAVPDSKVYDGTVDSTELPLVSAGTPLAAGDSASGLIQSFGSKHTGASKVITPGGVIGDGNGGANYSYTYSPISAGTITKRPITITAAADSKPYDGTTASGGIPQISAGTPLAPGDIAPIWTQAFDSAAVGAGRLLTPAGTVDDGNGGNNYSYTFVQNANGSITPRAVTVAADAKSKIVGTADPILTYHITNGSLVNGDTLALTRAPGEALGVYPISVALFPAAANYNLTFTGADFTIAPAPVFKSVGNHDGWVLESAENSSKGGSLNAGTLTFMLGDDAANRQYKTILSFNTSSLPDNAVITKAVLKISKSGVPVGSDPFGSFGSLLVDLRTGAFGTPSLAASDFQSNPSVYSAGIFSNVPSGSWYSAVLNRAGRLHINLQGFTQLRLYFAVDDNNDGGADFLRFLSGNSATGRPQLIITYTTP